MRTVIRLAKFVIAIFIVLYFPAITHADSGVINQPRSISTNYHTCVVQEAGTLRCWGGNGWGESNIPADLGLVESVYVRGDSTCAIQTSGILRCWGRNDYGQVSVPVDLGRVTQVGMGIFHTCAIVINGDVRCWDRNSSGQANVPGNLKASKVAAGWENTCAIDIMGDLVCWGRDDYGDYGKLSVPNNLGKVREISLGWVSACAIKVNDDLVCWGDSRRFQVPAGLGKVKSASVGWSHVCAITELDDLFCSGLNTNNQIIIPEDIGKVREVSSGDRGTCAIDSSNVARCWGANWYGESVPPLDLGKLRHSLFNNPIIIGNAYLNAQITSQQGSGVSGVTYSYQWLRDGEVIPGATLSTYWLTKSDYLRHISVKVTGVTQGLLTQTKTSSAAFVVKEAEAIGSLSFTGTARVNNKVTARFSNSSFKFDHTYQWFRNQSPITNESDKTYKLRPQDAGQSISVQTCRLFKGQITECVNKVLSQNVAVGLLGTVKASIVGVPKVHRLLTATVASRLTDLEIEYQWLRDGTEIQGATSKRYLIQTSDSGSLLSVRIHVSKPGYETQLNESSSKRVH